MLIEAIMRENVHSLPPSHTVEDAIRLSARSDIRHLPVVSEDRRLKGIVTYRDIEDAILSSGRQALALPLSAIMVREVITGHPLDFVEDAALQFYRHKIGCLPIVSDGCLVGIVTAVDMLHRYIELTGVHLPGSRIEVRVRDQIGELARIAGLLSDLRVHIHNVLTRPDMADPSYKALEFRVQAMNLTPIADAIRREGYDVLWPNAQSLRRL